MCAYGWIAAFSSPGKRTWRELAIRGTDAILGIGRYDTSAIAVLGGKTGAVKKTYGIGADTSISALTATDSTIVFGTTTPSRMTIESIDR